MRWPGHVEAGVDRRLASTVDIMPTILEAAGVRPDREVAALDGRSLLAPADGADRVVHSEYWEDRINSWIPTWAASFDGRVHYIEYYDAAGMLTFTELYDVAHDPTEDLNLARRDDMAPTVATLHQRLAAFRTCAGATCHQQALPSGPASTPSPGGTPPSAAPPSG